MKIKASILLFVFCYFFTIRITLAQQSSTPNKLDLPALMPKSPTTSELIKYAETNVDLSTGANPFEYPFFTISLNGFSLPVSLSNAGVALKPSEIATNYGFGWSLKGTGVLTIDRNLNGLEYESCDPVIGGFSNYMSSIKPNGSNEFLENKYSYVIPGSSGVFYDDMIDFKAPGNKIQSLGPYKYKITNSDGIGFIFGSTDPNSPLIEKSIKKLGPFSLDVKLLEFSATQGVNNENANLFYNSTAEYIYENINDLGDPKSVTGLLLGEITLPNSDDKIIFNYIQSNGFDQYTLLNEYTYIPDNNMEDQSLEYLHRTFQINSIYSSYLTSIEWPNGKINFIYSRNEDALEFNMHPDNNDPNKFLKEVVVEPASLASGNGRPKLDKVEVRHTNTELIKGYSLKYIYNTEQKLRKRLFLNSITEYSSGLMLPPTRFDYILTGLRAPSILTNFVDYWGYNNDGYQNNSTAQIRTSKVPLLNRTFGSEWDQHLNSNSVGDYIQNMGLHPIHYPSIFRINTNNESATYMAGHYDRNSNMACTYGMLKSVEYPTGGKDSFIFQLHLSNFYYGPYYSQTNHNIIAKGVYGGGVRVAEIRRSFGYGQANLIKQYLYGGGELLFVPQFVRSYFRALSQEFYIPRDAYFSTPLNKPNGNIITYRVVTEVIPGNGKTIYGFAYNAMDEDFTSSSPTFDYKIENLAILKPRIVDGFIGGTNYFHYQHKLDYFPYLSLPDYTWINSLLTKVLKYDENNRLVKEIDQSYIFNKKVNSVRYLSILNDLNKRRGSSFTLPFDIDGVLMLNEFKLCLGYGDIEQIITKNYHYDLNGNVSNNYIEQVDNSYNTLRQLKSNTKHNLDGSIEIVENLYVKDFNVQNKDIFNITENPSEEVLAVQNLLSLNILNAKLQEAHFVKKNNSLSSKSIKNARIWTYKNFGSKPLVHKEYFFNTNNEFTLFSGLDLNENDINFSWDSGFKLYRTYIKYNSKNKPLELLDKWAGKVSYKWGYNSSLPIAEIINSTNSNISIGADCTYLGFESNDFSASEDNDYWLINSNLCDFSSSSFTGKFALTLNSSPYEEGPINEGENPETPISYEELSSYCLKKSLQPMIDDKFIISGWIKPAQSNNNDLLGLKVKIVSNNQVAESYTKNIRSSEVEWTYFEFDIESFSSNMNSTVFITFENNSQNDHSILLDDLRIRPYNSTMKTFTYNEVFQLPTSLSDQNSKPNFYEYDSFGRLVTISDFKKNIIKSNVYLHRNK